MTDLLYRAEQQRRALVSETLLRWEMSLTHWIALRRLAKLGPCTMTQLAQAGAIDRTSLTRTIDSLIARNYVTRASSALDRRAVIVQTSPAGLDLAREVAVDIEALERQLLSALDSQGQDRLARDLGTLLAAWAPLEPRGEPISRRSRLV